MHDRTLNNLFTLIMILLVIVNTINMGGHSWTLRLSSPCSRNQSGHLLGSSLSLDSCHYFRSSLAGWSQKTNCSGNISLQTIKILHALTSRLGLFVLGCSPGGTGSNFWTLLLDGDINMSITMTFMSTMLALGFMPLWIFTLGKIQCWVSLKSGEFQDLSWLATTWWCPSRSCSPPW